MGGEQKTKNKIIYQSKQTQKTQKQKYRMLTITKFDFKQQKTLITSPAQARKELLYDKRYLILPPESNYKTQALNSKVQSPRISQSPTSKRPNPSLLFSSSPKARARQATPTNQRSSSQATSNNNNKNIVIRPTPVEQRSNSSMKIEPTLDNELIKSKIKRRLNDMIEQRYHSYTDRQRRSSNPEFKKQQQLLQQPPLDVSFEKKVSEISPDYNELKKIYIDYLEKCNPNMQRSSPKRQRVPSSKIPLKPQSTQPILLDVEKQQTISHVRPRLIKKQTFVTNLLEACSISPAKIIQRPNTAQTESRPPTSRSTTQRLVPILNQLLTNPQSPIQTFQPLTSTLRSSEPVHFKNRGTSNKTSPLRSYRTSYAAKNMSPNRRTLKSRVQHSIMMNSIGREKEHEKLAPWDIIHDQHSP